MIFYNNRYRGAFEYDKFLLNILGFHNIIEALDIEELYGGDSPIGSLSDIKQKLDIMFDDYIKPNGYCEKNYLQIIKGKESIR